MFVCLLCLVLVSSVILQSDRCLWAKTAMTLLRLVFGRFPVRILIVLLVIQPTSVAVCVLPVLTWGQYLENGYGQFTSSWKPFHFVRPHYSVQLWRSVNEGERNNCDVWYLQSSSVSLFLYRGCLDRWLYLNNRKWVAASECAYCSGNLLFVAAILSVNV